MGEEVFKIIIILVAGLVGGVVNTISAAGSLITLPAFIFAGLNPSVANGTNRIAILFQNTFAVAGFHSKGIKGDRYVWWVSLAAIPGAILGALFAVKIPESSFNKILSVVMLIFLAITLFNPLKHTEKGMERMGTKHKVLGLLAFFVSGLYGGFIQAGAGFFLMASGMLIHKFDIIKTNYYKAFVMMIYTIAALAVFIWAAQINWFYGIVMSIGTSAGGFIGSRWSVDAEAKWIKRVMVMIIVSLSIYLWLYK